MEEASGVEDGGSEAERGLETEEEEGMVDEIGVVVVDGPGGTGVDREVDVVFVLDEEIVDEVDDKAFAFHVTGLGCKVS